VRGLALAALFAWPAPRSAATEPAPALDPALAEQIATDAAAIAAQQRVNQISDETRELLLQYRQHLAEAKSLRDYVAQLTGQVKSQRDEIGFIEQQLGEIEVTAREVTPLMQRMVDTLDRFVDLDLPFLVEERRKRVQSLKEMMTRADVTISEKYRRILEAYQIETEYGRTLETYQASLGEGAGARTVRFLRIGRVALLYQTMDGKETGYWDAGRKDWVVDDAYRTAVRHGFEVADKVGAPDLLIVPVAAPVENRS
jgi:hypothetical protein